MAHPDAPTSSSRVFCAEASRPCVDVISRLHEDGYPVSNTVFQDPCTQLMRLACLVDNPEDVDHVYNAMRVYWVPIVDDRAFKAAVIMLERRLGRSMTHPGAPTIAPRTFCTTATEACFRDLRTLDLVGRAVRTVFTAVPIRRHVCMVETPGDESYVWALMRKHWVPSPDQAIFNKDVSTLERIIHSDGDIPLHIPRYDGEE